jgi:hypothetical protein
MQILWICKIQLFWRVHPRFQDDVVDAANAIRVRVFFEDMLLELLEKQRIVVIILEKRLTLVHGILPGRVKCLCRSLLLRSRNPQFLSNSFDEPLATHTNGIGSTRRSRRHIVPGL